MKESWLLSNISLVWTCITIVLSVAIGLQIGSVLMFKTEAPKYGVHTNSFTDLWMMGVSLCFISLYRQGGMSLVRPYVEKRLKKLDPESDISKIDKNSRAFVSFGWYTFTTVREINLVVRFLLLLWPSSASNDLLWWLQMRGNHIQVAKLSYESRRESLLYDSSGSPRTQCTRTHPRLQD